MTYPRNKPYTIKELDKIPSGVFAKLGSNYPAEWKGKLSMETITMIISGKRITNDEFHKMRGNSYDWKTRYPMLDNDALIKRVQYIMDNCVSISNKSRYCTSVTYEECLRNSLVPLLMDRLEEADTELAKVKEELEKVKEDAREAVNTSWRVINNLPHNKKNEDWPFAGFLESAKYHLKRIDYIF